jgi:dipeptidyl aminopeptidase/acylaminoacyl peptidase
MIAFHTTRDGGFSIYTMQADGSDQSRLGSGQDPNWSPDGARIVYYDQIPFEFNVNIFVMDADGSNPTNLTNSTTNDYQPTWSPAGDRIAFVRDDENGFGNIHVMRLETLIPVDITADPGIDDYPAWQPVSTPLRLPINDPPKTLRGDVIVFSSNQGTPFVNLFKLELRPLGGNVLTQLTFDTNTNYFHPRMVAGRRQDRLRRRNERRHQYLRDERQRHQ